MPSSQALEAAGEQLEDVENRNTRALALLEAPYLVAAGDGLDAEERQAITALIAHLVGNAEPDKVCDVLDWFDERVTEEGVEARIAHVGASFTSRSDREQVLGFAALLALADRRLALREQERLISLGEALGFKRVEVQMLVHKISLRLERAMAVSIQPPPPLQEEYEGAAVEEGSVGEGDRHTPAPDTPPAGSTRGGLPPTERSG